MAFAFVAGVVATFTVIGIVIALVDAVVRADRRRVQRRASASIVGSPLHRPNTYLLPRGPTDGGTDR